MASKTRDGEYWKYGHGGTASNDITFDPELNRVCIGTGNSGPYHPEIRSPDRTGDNLFLCSIVALDADTGDYIWHYQVNPREVWDFKAIMDIILADLEIGGRAQGADLSHFTIYIGKLGLRMLQRGVPGCQLFVLLLFGRGWLAPPYVRVNLYCLSRRKRHHRFERRNP